MLKHKSHNLTGIFFCSLCALVWGFAFIAQQKASSDVPTFAFNGLRFSLAVGVIGVFILVNMLIDKKKGVKRTGWNKSTLLGGTLCGICLFIANNLQQYAIARTTVGKTGFITALYIVIVPLLNVLLRKRIPVNGKFAIAFAVLGFYVMCINDSSGVTYADVILLICAVTFSLHIMFIDVFVDETDPLKLTFTQFVVASLLSLPVMAIEGFPPASAVGQNITSILYVGVMSAGVGFTFQSLGQKYAPPELATLIMSLESVIAFIGGVAFLNESYSAKEFVGCIIVLLSVFLAQISLPQKMLKPNYSKYFID